MRNEVIVKKLIAHADKVIKYCEGLTYEQFKDNSILIEACIFNLGQIGELSNRIDDDFAEANNNIPWKQIYGLRNHIVHDYDGVNLQLIWEIIRDDLPVLYNDLNKIKF